MINPLRNMTGRQYLTLILAVLVLLLLSTLFERRDYQWTGNACVVTSSYGGGVVNTHEVAPRVCFAQ